MSCDHRKLMNELGQRHQSLLKLIQNNSVHYFDIPVHDNIGDLLIYLGTLKFLQKNNITIKSSSSLHNCPTIRDDSIILLHGGGNLGDLYIWHQVFRERIISANHNRRIIILPQSIHFQRKERFEQARRIMSSHPDLHLCVRDEKSLDIARQLCQNAILLPDMAHQLYPIIQPTCTPRSGTLHLLRTDRETTSKVGASLSGEATCADWPDLVGYPRARRIRRAIRVVKFLSGVGFSSITSRYFSKWWEYESNQLVTKAIILFSEHSYVVTDRLHAHILACLMDIPNMIYDNTYGKNSSYIKAWTDNSPLIKLVRS